MRYRRPHYYEQFSCIAGACPDTCCAGWQIMIDEESLEKYRHVAGTFSDRIKHSVDWEEACFRQDNLKRCAFLNEKNLCDLYENLGKEALCETCRKYPRHVEEFEGIREISLSLSCPEAARIILQMEEPVAFIEQETEEPEYEEDYEEFDFLLYGMLEEARNDILKVVQNRAWKVEKRMQCALRMAEKFQKALEEGTLFRESPWLEKMDFKYENRLEAQARFEKMKTWFTVFDELEVLRDEWTQFLQEVSKTLYENGWEKYEDIRRQFEEQKREGAGFWKRWEVMLEQLMVFWIYTYFCGAVYDDLVYAKMMLSVFSVEWFEEFCMAMWYQQGKELAFETILKIAWSYAREIEHSDYNLVTLDEIFSAYMI